MATFHPIETNGGTTTTWVPLTTQLPLATACFSAIYSQEGGGNLIAFDPFYYSIAPTFTTECIPPEATEWWNQPHSLSSSVSSLGPKTCPQAYTTAFNVSAGVGSTRIGCCPSGYSFQATSVEYGTVGQCASSLTPGQSYSFLALSRSPGPWFLSKTAAGPLGSSVLAVQINGWNFGNAVAASTTSSTASTSSSSATSSSSSSAAATSLPSSGAPTTTSPSASSSNGGGLSGGASAGVGVGAAVALLAAVGLLIFLLLSWRRRRRQEQQQQHLDSHMHEAPQGSEQYYGRYGVWKQPTAKAPEVLELSSQRGPFELGQGGG